MIYGIINMLYALSSRGLFNEIRILPEIHNTVDILCVG